MKSEPWYIHTVLYVIIIALIYVLIRVAIVEPKRVMEEEKFYKNETRKRMTNIKEAEILWQYKYGQFTDDLDSLIQFVKTDTLVRNRIEGIDSITGRSSNPFVKLANGEFTPDSLYFTPKTHSKFILQVDTTSRVDTVINRRGRIVSIDTVRTIGNRYYLEDPNGYGTIGDLNNDALKNTASWE